MLWGLCGDTPVYLVGIAYTGDLLHSLPPFTLQQAGYIFSFARRPLSWLSLFRKAQTQARSEVFTQPVGTWTDMSKKPPADNILTLSHIGWRLMVIDARRTSVATSNERGSIVTHCPHLQSCS